jgi:Ca2+-transporting ATPase
MTIIFNTFVFLQFFNQINCRVIGVDEYNIFKKPFNSLWFLLIIGIIFFVQWSATTWLLFIFETSSLTGEQFFTGVIYGMTVWIAALALKLTPVHWVEKIPIHVDENEIMGADNILMASYEKHAKGPIPMNRGINEEEQLIEENDEEY